MADASTARGEFLLEIGCEEMPASWLPGLTEQLARATTDIAARELLEPTAVVAHAAPRRLVVRADVLERQPDREEVVFGPAMKAAKDVAGKWTGAAGGFAKKCGVEPGALGVGAKDPAKPAELYLSFVKKTPGRGAAEVLPAVVAAMLRGLAFPKRMSWDAWLDDGKGAFPFGRPIRWLVCLLGGAVVPFEIRALVGGAPGEVILRAAKATRGHRFLPAGAAGEPIEVSGFQDLQEKLRRHFVLLYAAERAEKIRGALRSAAGAATVGDDHGLVDEWIHLVEWPVIVTGRVPEEFRGLPREVIETVLVHHQKYLPLVEDGQVVRFAAVTNTEGAQAEIVRGMERVVVARLRDGAFFFAEDRKRPLASRVDDLAGVTFHQGLGSYKDKAARMARLVDVAAERGWLAAAEGKSAREATLLAKADLTTLMVREFTELQGVVGGLYLDAEGGSEPAVRRAVRLHYLPVSVAPSDAPAGVFTSEAEARVFAAVSVADKLDTVAGYFAIGETPTGSRDPYGLRRAGQGAVRAVLDFWGGTVPSLRGLVAAAVAGYAGVGKRGAEDVTAAVLAFLIERLQYILESRGYPADEVAAVLDTGPGGPHPLDDVADCLARLTALHGVRGEVPEEFALLTTAFRRARNILAGQKAGRVDRALCRETAELGLFDAVAALGDGGEAYAVRLRSLAGLAVPVDLFFTDVLVMAEDAAVRANRLGLLERALSVFYRIADISKLGG